jgi:hypothetical protein
MVVRLGRRRWQRGNGGAAMAAQRWRRGDGGGKGRGKAMTLMDEAGGGRRRRQLVALCGAGILLPLGVRGAVCA